MWSESEQVKVRRAFTKLHVETLFNTGENFPPYFRSIFSLFLETFFTENISPESVK